MDEGQIYQFYLPDTTATGQLAKVLAGLVHIGDIIALEGDLGAGKTTFGRAFITALMGAEEVPSPTFSLVQIYEPADDDLETPTVWHFDLYRLEDASEVFELGIDQAFDDGVSLIEWPDRLGRYLPGNHLKLELLFGDKDTERIARLEGGQIWQERLEKLALTLSPDLNKGIKT